MFVAPLSPPAPKAAAPSAQHVRKVEVDDEQARPYAQTLAAGFGTEMIGTVYLAQRLARAGQLGERSFSPAARASAVLPISLLLGQPGPTEGRGLALPRTLRSPVEHAGALWLALPPAPSDERERSSLVAGRLGALASRLASTAGAWERPTSGPPTALIEAGYALAMEVVAREWKSDSGPRGASFAATAATATRERFADVRENKYVLADDGDELRPPAALLAHPGVLATIFHRMAQTRTLASRPAPAAFYAPFVPGPLPAGINPAAFLGTFRNFQAKLLTIWMRAALTGRPPADAADIVELWGAEFPEEKAEAVRIFVVTTFGGTLKPGGVSRRTEDATLALAELDALVQDVVAGRRTLRGDAGAAR